MSVATLTNPVNRSTSQPSRSDKSSQGEDRHCRSGTKACENCRRKQENRIARKKKKTLKRQRTWRGAFKGTLDF